MRHLDTNRHAWRVYYTPITSAIPVFTGRRFTNAPTAAATALEIPARKGISHLQHTVFGVVPHHMLKFIALIPSQHWGYENKVVHDHPKYLEWLNEQRERNARFISPELALA